ncbi:MAG: hypothetical protein K9L28_05965 [Synergistales bacterium]|nr:hypothetical protein [Synergistales bacterium]
MSEEERTDGQFRQFLEALRQEYEKRYETQRRAMEERLSDRIAERRRLVEGEIESGRREIAEERQRRLLKVKRFLLQRYREEVAEQARTLQDTVSRTVEAKLLSVKASPASWYALHRALLREAVDALRTPCIAGVPPGLSALQQEFDEVETVREEIDHPWGGCLVFDAETETRIIDNRLATRWRQLGPELLEQLGQCVEPYLQEVDRFSRELRVYERHPSRSVERLSG